MAFVKELGVFKMITAVAGWSVPGRAESGWIVPRWVTVGLKDQRPQGLSAVVLLGYRDQILSVHHGMNRGSFILRSARLPPVVEASTASTSPAVAIGSVEPCSASVSVIVSSFNVTARQRFDLHDIRRLCGRWPRLRRQCRKGDRRLHNGGTRSENSLALRSRLPSPWTSERSRSCGCGPGRWCGLDSLGGRPRCCCWGTGDRRFDGGPNVGRQG